jgi:hypothetical protein
VLSVGVLFGTAISYFHFGEKFIVSVAIPDGFERSVSVGTVRTQFATENLLSSMPAEMLMARAPYENEVQKLWSADSAEWVRTRIYGSYLGVTDVGKLHHGDNS